MRRSELYYYYCMSHGRKTRVPIEKIVYAEIQNHELSIRTNGWGTICTNQSMSAFLQEMPREFIRVHNSYAVNANYLMMVGYGICMVAGGTELPVGRQYQGMVYERFQGVGKNIEAKKGGSYE